MHNDNLQWEVHRLDAENQKLRSENPEASNRLDLETKLEQTKSDVVALTEQVQAYQRQLEELRERAGAETTTDGRSTELELVREELDGATERQKVVELERTLTTRDTEVDELKAARGDTERELVTAKSDAEWKLAEIRRDAEQELEFTRRNAELECYRAKWEAGVGATGTESLEELLYKCTVLLFLTLLLYLTFTLLNLS